MTKENRDYLEMSFRSIQCFADDGHFSPTDLQEIIAIALRDGVVDDNEKRVLRNIVLRLRPAELSAAMQSQLADLQKLLA